MSDKIWRYEPPIRVQARTADEAKARIESRLKGILLHPEGISVQEVVEVNGGER